MIENGETSDPGGKRWRRLQMKINAMESKQHFRKDVQTAFLPQCAEKTNY